MKVEVLPKATWYRNCNYAAHGKQEWALRPERDGDLLATVLVVDVKWQHRVPNAVMWTTYGPNNSMGYEASVDEAKAAAITALAVRALEQP